MRRLRLALILSVFVNLFLLGALAGGGLWVHRRHAAIAAGALRIAGSELPRDERRAFRLALRDARRQMRPTLEQGRAARLRAAALLRAPAVDQAAVLAALAQARAADLSVRAAVEARAVAVATTLPPADRTRLADAVAARAARPLSRRKPAVGAFKGVDTMGDRP